MKRTKIKTFQKDDDNNKGIATATALSSDKEDTAWANRPVFSGFLGGNVRNIYMFLCCYLYLIRNYRCVDELHAHMHYVLLISWLFRYSSPRKDFEE